MTSLLAATSYAVVAILTLAAAPVSASEPALQSDWADGHSSRTRVTAGKTTGAKPELYAFVEIELEPGWKTYWRNPGDSGIPPKFDFQRSKNIAKAEVLYPAPSRIADPGGDIVGYKGRVIFPVRLTLIDASKPADIGADVQFGICKDICVPSEANLNLTIPASTASEVGDDNGAMLAKVPREVDAISNSDPKPTKVTVDLKSAKPLLSVQARFSGGSSGADVFVEAPDGLYLPLLVKTAEAGEDLTFEADLSKDVDLAALAGKTLIITTVSAKGASESTHKIE